MKGIRGVIRKILNLGFRWSVKFHLLLLLFDVDFRAKTTPAHLPDSPRGSHQSVRRNSKKSILFVGMSDSPHFRSWLEGSLELGIFSQIWVLPSDCPSLPLHMKELDVESGRQTKFKVFRFYGSTTFNKLMFRIFDSLTKRYWRSYILHRYIKRLKPDYVHFHELQHGAYIYNPISGHPRVKRNYLSVCSTWGSDLTLYAYIESHHADLREVLSWTDVLTTERTSELLEAQSLGYSGMFMSPVYITVGKKQDYIGNVLPPSERKNILIKGYQDSHGRALNGLRALEESGCSFVNVKIRCFSSSLPTRVQVEYLKYTRGWDIEVIEHVEKAKILELFANARIYIGLSISDGLSTSMVEAMSMGAFPIQSSNSAAPDFIINGISGFVVDPWDIGSIASAISRSLDDGVLVDEAARINAISIDKKYNYAVGLEKMKEIYSL